MSTEKLRFAADALDSAAAYKLITAVVTPRPIAWVGSLNDSGACNLAPFSSFTFVSYDPPKVLISIGPGGAARKDTTRNIMARGEFTISAVTADLLDPMVDSSFAYPPDMAEAERLAIPLSPSTQIATPFVSASPAAMECRLDRVIEVGDRDQHDMLLGTVVAFHIAPEIWAGDRIDPALYQPIGRLGGPLYVERGALVTRAAPKDAPR